MVTTMENRVETRQTTLEELGKELGIPIKVRPWWGSRKARNNQIHAVCGTEVFDAWNFERHTIEPWCSSCRHHIPRSEIKVVQVRHTWLCPRLKYPQAQNGTVVFWEGDCGMKGHNHCQSLAIIDITDGDFLVRLRAGITGRNFLIGKDDGHPFATAIPRNVITVQDAFDWLVPNLIRKAYILGKEVKRQGDWFFIPDKAEPTTRPSHWSDLRVRGSDPELYPNRLYHDVSLIYNGVQTRHTGELVVYKGLINTCYGAPRVKGEIRAPDHPTLKLESWHIGVRSRGVTGSRDESSNPGID